MSAIVDETDVPEHCRMAFSTDQEEQVHKQEEVEKLKGENAALQTSLRDLETKSSQQLEALTATVEENGEIIKKQNEEISSLMDERESLRYQVEESQNSINQDKKLMKKLKMEHCKQVEILKQNINELNKVKSQNLLQKEQLENSKILVKSYKTQFKQMNMQYQQQQIFIRRFEEDLQSCVPLITKSKELRQKFIDLKSRYLDDGKGVLCSEKPEQEYEVKISFLEKKLESLTRIRQNDAKIRRQMQHKFFEILSTFYKKESHYTQLLSEEEKKSNASKMLIWCCRP
ncbi:puff II/9-1 protein-like [Takifugu rubripes]|uniref:puff II/9-1 protein-like n=1 Tax=Takifugu rubripes TaxID=31033 RepID=UPI0011453498|nr:puff II/9-1 protein-like [Takifugu rubripes]